MSGSSNMTQQSHCWAYTLRKPELKETHVPQCSLQHCLQIARTWNQPRCPSADEWIRKLWYTYLVEYYSAIEKEHIWVTSNKVDETGSYYTAKVRTRRTWGIFVKQINVLENVQYVMWQMSLRKKSVLFKSGKIIVLSAYQSVAFLIQFYHVQYFMWNIS